MSKYIEDLTKQLVGKNVQNFTNELKASHNLSKILKDQNEIGKQAKVKADIQRLLRQ
ncbi:unnamed protein product [marine sediment metagenome]|uniref:Uncharacterized protein n=1 Tax=marine sediment metagenome TaxID=412755 RepID=X0URV7_9ZZZZ